MNCTLYMLYNADGSVLGKLRYGYRKIASKRDGPECAACDITHGGLSLSESPSWEAVKKELVSTGIDVVQWHRDELSPQVKEYVDEHKTGYPVALLQRDGKLQVAMDKTELARCDGDAQLFAKELRRKGLFTT